ncbi:hypothetical protein EZV62_003973 [Acer yangbiense]|uniref:Uncharacterized protein n=1 Tax=Acer yangbiense TaxID=1000413 RepID=A0A5C7IIS7_9ROSI|nr:hypothetical protein EZV62_003973 [Acer yangbiense]
MAEQPKSYNFEVTARIGGKAMSNHVRIERGTHAFNLILSSQLVEVRQRNLSPKGKMLSQGKDQVNPLPFVSNAKLNLEKDRSTTTQRVWESKDSSSSSLDGSEEGVVVYPPKYKGDSSTGPANKLVRGNLFINLGSGFDNHLGQAEFLLGSSPNGPENLLLELEGLASSNLVVGKPDDVVGNIQCNRHDRGDSSFSGTEVGSLVKKRNAERIHKSLIHKTEKWNLEVEVAKDSQAESESEPEKEKEKRSSPEGRFWAFTNLKTQPQATV